MAYKMVAERDDQKVIKERASALIVLANARVWESEGWQVMITDAEGKEFDTTSFEKLLGPGYTWSPQVPLVPSPQFVAMTLTPQAEDTFPEEAGHASDAASDIESEELAAENFDELESIEEAEHDEEFESLEANDEYGDFEPFDEAEELEDELEPHH